MEQSPTQLPEVSQVNKRVIIFVTIFAVSLASFAFLFGEESSDENSLLGSVLNLIIKDQNVNRVIIGTINAIFSVVLILSFALALYFLNEKEKIKKKYKISGGDETDKQMKDVLEKNLGEFKKDDKDKTL